VYQPWPLGVVGSLGNGDIIVPVGIQKNCSVCSGGSAREFVG
jgi:hypothetical protein